MGSGAQAKFRVEINLVKLPQKKLGGLEEF